MYKIYSRLRYPEFISDLRRIREVSENHGVLMNLEDCERLWIERSEKMEANWLDLPRDNDLLWAEVEDTLGEL